MSAILNVVFDVQRTKTSGRLLKQVFYRHRTYHTRPPVGRNTEIRRRGSQQYLHGTRGRVWVVGKRLKVDQISPFTRRSKTVEERRVPARHEELLIWSYRLNRFRDLILKVSRIGPVVPREPREKERVGTQRRR